MVVLKIQDSTSSRSDGLFKVGFCSVGEEVRLLLGQYSSLQAAVKQSPILGWV